MPLIVYQVGNVPIFHSFQGVDNSGLEVETGRSWVLSTTEFTGISGEHLYNDPARPIAKRIDASIKGNIVSDDDIFIDKTLSKLMSYGGTLNIPIIAFHYESRDELNLLDCSACGNCQLRWMVNYATIQEISRSSVIKSQDDWFSLSYQPVDLKLSLDWRWEVLNPYIWEYRINSEITNPIDPLIHEEALDNIFYHPNQISTILKNAYFFCWKNRLSAFSTAAWGDRFLEGRIGGYGIDFSDVGEYEFFSDPQFWSAPPSSVYAFNRLDTSGTITIKVRRPFGIFAGDYIETEASLDLAELDTQLDDKGFVGLSKDDIIITGNVQPFPGFILRDDEIIVGIRPKWSYDGLYPGETAIGYNYLTFLAEDTDARVAFLHNYGAY